MTTSGMAEERVWSKVLFGNSHMLSVAGVISNVGPGMVTAPDVMASTELGGSTVHRLLEDLTTVGLIVRVPRERLERTQRYRRRDHPFWDAVTLLRDDAQRSSGSELHRDEDVQRKGV